MTTTFIGFWFFTSDRITVQHVYVYSCTRVCSIVRRYCVDLSTKKYFRTFESTFVLSYESTKVRKYNVLSKVHVQYNVVRVQRTHRILSKVRKYFRKYFRTFVLSYESTFVSILS